MSPLIELLPLAVALLGGLGGYLLRRHVAQERLDVWRHAADLLLLRELTWSSRPSRPLMSGLLGLHRVWFEWYKTGKGAGVTRVTVDGASGMTLVPEDSAWRASAEREIELGDDAFDAEVSIRGDPDRVRAMLDAETRSVVRRMFRGIFALPGTPQVAIRGTVTLVDGHLRADFDELPTAPTPRELAEGTNALLALAARFEKPASEVEQLARSIATEPHWRVRLNGLETLANNYPRDPAAIAALRHALADDVAELRLQAAIALGEEGRETLLEIALGRPEEGTAPDAAGRERLEDATVAHAIDALGDHFPPEACEPLLVHALRARRLETADACVQALGRVGGPDADRLLGKVLSREAGRLAVAAATALGKRRSPEAEAALLHALERGIDELTIPVIAALGRAGTARGIPAIKDVAEGPGSDDAVRRVARQAVAAIQSRLPGASPGQLSIAEADVGRLSLADDDPRGRVSLAERS